MRKTLQLNSSKLNSGVIPEFLLQILNDDSMAEAAWEAKAIDNGQWELSSELYPAYICDVQEDSGVIFDRDFESITSPFAGAGELSDWLYNQMETHRRLAAYYDRLAEQARGLNCDLSKDGAERIKNVFKSAQDAVDFPKGFRYTAFRQNRSEDSMLSTLMYTSSKLGATQWVVKSALSASFEGELRPGSSEIETQNSWSFQPNYDPEAKGGDYRHSGSATGYERGGQGIRVQDRFYQFPGSDKPNMNPTDMQAARWLVLILQQMIDDILENPPARCYEYLLADGLLKKKNLANMADAGLLRLVVKGLIDGVTALKAKPSIWRQLLERGYVTGEHVYKVQPNQLFWLASHDHIPVERAIELDPSLKNKLARAGKDIAEVEVDDTSIEGLVNRVADGVLTPQKAWAIDHKIIKPLVEAKLISAYDAYKLDPSILNWMLENRHVGRAEAKRLKPNIKKEMDKKGVDWESLDASRPLKASRDLRRVSLSKLKTNITDKLNEVMQSENFGYLAEELPDMAVVDVRRDNGRIEVEVRAEVASYGAMQEIADSLNPIVQSYDKGAYFDMVTGGIMVAVIE